MGDEDWEAEATTAAVSVPAPSITKPADDFDENNNNNANNEKGFRSLDKNNNEATSGGGGFGFKKQSDDNNNDNSDRRGSGGGGFGFRKRDDNGENKSGGFGGGGGFGRRNNDESGGERRGGGSGGFGRRNNDESGGERRGGFGGGGGFGGRRNNDENGDNKGGFNNFRKRDESGGGERRGGGFGGGGGFGRRNNDENGENRGGGGGGFGRRNNDENGGERRGGGFGGGFNRRNNDENGENKSGGFGRRNNDENGENKSGGFGGGGFGRRNNDENGEKRGGFGGGGFRPRQNNDENGENKSGGFGGGGGGFRKRNDGEEGGENKGGFGRGGGFGGRRNNDGEDGEKKFGGGGGGFGRRNNDGEDGERKSGGFGGGGGFGRRNNDGEEGERKSGGFGGGGFNRRNNDGEDGEKKSGFGGGSRGFGNRNNEEGGGGGGFKRGGFGGGGGDGERSGGFNNRRSQSNERGGDGERKGGFGGNRDRSAGPPGGRQQRGEGGEGEAKDGEAQKERYIPKPIDDDDEEALFHTIATGVNFKKQAEIPVSLSGEDTDSIKPIESFTEPGFSETLLDNIKRSKYEIPTPVQKYAIPVIMKRRDLMACAQTGSGKTAAYLLPILANILEDGVQSGQFSPVQTPQALIIAPTRELAIQILTECKKFGFHSIIKSNILYGGTVTGFQLKDLEKGTNILVATPGRLLDVINKGKISLEKVKYIVLDEADRMLDLGFIGPVREILGKCALDRNERCTFMFSATFPTEIQKLAQDFLNRYLFLTIGVVGGANTDVEQIIYQTTQFEKRNKLLEILNDVGNERIMIFLEHKKQADILAFFLCQKNYPATSIHGDRLQSQREQALRDFTKGSAKIIVCTQVAARGLDISDVNHVINYDLPQTIDEYVHRIGRTGRCGNIGKAISFFDTESENDRNIARNLVRILTQAAKEVPDWLNSIAENATGPQFGSKNCTNDIRNSFKSLAVTTTTTAAAAPAGGATEEDW